MPTTASAIYFDLMTGRPSALASSMRRRVSAYTRDHLVRGFKIGITNNPEARYARYSADYDEAGNDRFTSQKATSKPIGLQDNDNWADPFC